MKYVETFDRGPGGWFGWDQSGFHAFELHDGAVVSHSPWWVDYNHAPPGAGYLHIVFGLHTKDGELARKVAGENRFVAGKYPTDFTNARITVRIKGDLDSRGAQLVLLAQAETQPGRPRINSVLIAQPIRVTPEWSEQTITCVPDNGQWTCLGSRHSAMDNFGWGPIAPVLKDLNLDILFVLFPLKIVPTVPVEGDMHLRRAGRDYLLDLSRLPSGHVMLDEVRIEFP